jgi:hypothetical protein
MFGVAQDDNAFGSLRMTMFGVVQNDNVLGRSG